MLPREPRGENPSSPLPALGGSRLFVTWFMAACVCVLCLCLHMSFSSVMSLCLLSSSYKDTVTGCRAHRKSRMILSSEPEHPIEALFLSSHSEWCELWGTLFIYYTFPIKSAGEFRHALIRVGFAAGQTLSATDEPFDPIRLSTLWSLGSLICKAGSMPGIPQAYGEK